MWTESERPAPERAVRVIGFVEGLSWLVLLFVAMPLKYGLDLPVAVRIVGSAHGALFVLFTSALTWAHFGLRWRLSRSVLLMLTALLPFGFLFVERVFERGAGETAPG